MKTYKELLQIVNSGYEDLTISPQDFIEFMRYHGGNIPLLVGDKKVWVHLENHLNFPYMENDKSSGEIINIL